MTPTNRTSDPPPEYIQLEDGDDVVAIRDRLSFIRGRRVLIISPEQGTALQRKLDLVLIQREAKRRVIQLAFVTHDLILTQHAHELGISVFETVEQSEQHRWKRGRTRVFTQRFHKPADNPDPEELMPVASRIRAPRRQWAWWQKIFGRVAILTILVIAIGGASYLTLPGAVVTLTLSRNTITAQSTITASTEVTDVNIEQQSIPATILLATVQTNSTINTSGIQQIEDLASIGFATFTNQTPRTITIPAGTRISTSAGTPITFTTNADLALPGGVGQRADVAITALIPGSSGNINAGMINTVEGELAQDVTVRNLAATTGGESRAYAVATQQDYDRLLALARGQLQAIAFEEMRLNLTESQRIVIETVRITEERTDWTTYSHEIGAVTDTLTLSMRAVVEATAIDDRFARQILFAQLSAIKPPQSLILSDTFQYNQSGDVIVASSNTMTFTATADATVITQINPAMIASQIAGMAPQQALNFLQSEIQLAPDTPPVIHLEPHWLTHLPYLPIRIHIQID